jgi:hypothetical protein
MKAARRTLSCIAFGVRFELTADTEALLAKMQERAPWSAEVCDDRLGQAGRFSVASAGEAYCLSASEEVLAEGAELGPILDRLGRELMVHVAEHSPERVFVHAGVVGWHGDALVLPGASFAGKTTLVAALVRAGATYYSDEYAVIDENGRVYPYARELQMREAGGIMQRAVAIDEIDGCMGTGPRPVSRVVFTQYAEGAVWQPEPVSPGMAALEMMRHTIPVRRSPARVMESLARMMEAATALRSMRGEAEETAAALLAAMSMSACEAAR